MALRCNEISRRRRFGQRPLIKGEGLFLRLTVRLTANWRCDRLFGSARMVKISTEPLLYNPAEEVRSV